MSKNILIVENDSALSRAMKDKLVARGFSVDETNDGKGCAELPLSSAAWWAWGNRLEENHRFPRSRFFGHACATESVESGSCVRSSLRNRSPYSDGRAVATPFPRRRGPDLLRRRLEVELAAVVEGWECGAGRGTVLGGGFGVGLLRREVRRLRCTAVEVRRAA